MKSKYTFNVLSLALIILSLALAIPSNAQRPERKAIRDKIDAQHAAFVTKQLDLTPQEAKVFWPVFNEFQQKRQALNKEFREKYKGFMDENENLTEKQYKEFADSQLLLEQQLLDLKKEYHAKFLSILPAAKVVKLYQADRQFKRILLKKLNERRGQGGWKPGPMGE